MVAVTLALVSSILLAQVTPQIPFAKITEYLQLSSSQRNALLQNLDGLDQSRRTRTTEIIRLTHEAYAATTTPTVDELTLGRIYAAIEEQCRGAREDEKHTRKLNLSLLTDVQRTGLETLAEARKLGPILFSARSLFLISADSFGTTDYPAGTQASYLTGCFLPSYLRVPSVDSGDAPAYLELRPDQLHQLRSIIDSLKTAGDEQIQTLQATFNLVAEATEQQVVDPATLGRHYAAIEKACREWRSQASQAREDARAVLDVTQRERLRPIAEAARLSGAIRDAESVGLLSGWIDFSLGRDSFRLAGNPMDETCTDLPLANLFPNY